MGNPLNLLVIEDSASDFALVTRHLAHHGLEAICRRVSSPEEVEQALAAAEPWDAVLSDYSLPGMDFSDTFARLRRRYPEVAVIVVSGTIGEERAVELLRLGVSDFVLKDNLVRLGPAIRRAIDATAATRARRAAEQALHEREAQYFRLVEATFDCIWEADAEGRYTWISPRIATLLGYSPDEVVGRRRTELMREDEAARIQAVFAAIVAERRPFTMVEAVFRHRDGRDVVLESSGLPIVDAAGNFLGHLGASRDVSEKKKAEAEAHRHAEHLSRTFDTLVRTNAALERLTFAASHDLQEPVRNIVSFAQMIERRLGAHADAELRQDLSFMIQGAYRMRDIVGGLMRLAEVSQGTAAWEVHDGGTLVAAAQAGLAAEITRSGATIAVGALPPVLADGEQLQEVFACLLSNAIKFARPDHPPTIRVAAERADDGWLFTVADDGPGIERPYLEQVFQPFQRLQAGGGYPGAGLGLAIARRIVERHGGRIWADSRPGRGTTMSFILPPLAP